MIDVCYDIDTLAATDAKTVGTHFWPQDDSKDRRRNYSIISDQIATSIAIENDLSEDRNSAKKVEACSTWEDRPISYHPIVSEDNLEDFRFIKDNISTPLSVTKQYQGYIDGLKVNKEESFWTKAERNYRRFRDDLVHVFEEFPIEDGMRHPADEIIKHALCDANHGCRDALVRGYYEFNDLRPAISAAFLRCTARVDFTKIGDIGLSLAQDALDHNNIEIREAAVRALENWGGREAINILRNHNDTESWLRRYIDQVIVDLSNTTS